MGEIMARLLRDLGWQVFGYREYPSLIKGGHSSYQLSASNSTIQSTPSKCHILVSTSRKAAHMYAGDVLPTGIIIHNVPQLEFASEVAAQLARDNIRIEAINTHAIVEEIGAHKLTQNVVLLGLVSRLINIPLQAINADIAKQFNKKPQLIPQNEASAAKGYKLLNELPNYWNAQGNHPLNANTNTDFKLVTGNQALVLGAIQCGVRAFYGYPMTPSSSILSYAATLANQTGIVVKQAEDEITAAQMAIGSMFMGARSLVATSGGGFDLMTETVSLAGITETPFVCVLGQRPGPATGMPTWTSATDLNLAIYAGHGEFPRCVVSASDAKSAFDIVQKAMDIADKYQLPVIILSEKHIAESLFSLKQPPAESETVQRHLVTADTELANQSRYSITPSGISPRWLPGTLTKTYLANSDEHLANGDLTEDAQPAKEMQDKRLRKLSTLHADLPEPIHYGDKDARHTLVGWGSTLMVMQDLLKDAPIANNYSYLHYEYLWPLRTEALKSIAASGKQLVVVEQNATGQLQSLLAGNTNIDFGLPIRKYDGRPFFFDELKEILLKRLQ